VNTCEPERPLAVLVGAGPGDPDLVTLAGAKWLSIADVVIYDRLASPSLLRLCRRDAELIYVGKAGGEPSIAQEQITALLVEKCRRNRLVVRLKGGDPFIFGRGGEEVEALVQAGIPFRVVPGITAAIGAGAYGGIPLTDRRFGSTLTFVTGHEDPTKDVSAINWSALAGIDTLVFYMGVGNLPVIADRLMSSGRPGQTPVAIVHQATSPRQQVVIATLSTIAAEAAKAGIRPPALIIVGGVVALRERFAWFEKLPLFGRTVLVTRTREQASQLTERLSQLGAEVLEAPTIAIEPPASYDALDAALGRLGEFDWLVLTSPNGVASMLDRMQALGMDARALAGTRVAAVGPATAKALQERFIRPDLAPEEGTTEALGVALGEKGSVKGKRVLLACADIATEDLASILRRAGAGVEEVALYRTVSPASLPPEAVDALKAGHVDWITFTSSSTVENFLKLTAALDLKAARAKIAAIGPVTAKTLQTHGLSPTVVARPHTIPGLVEAIVRFEAQTSRG